MAYDGKLKFDTGIDTSDFQVGLDSSSSMVSKGLSLLSSSFSATFEASMSQVMATMGISKDTITEDGVKPVVSLELITGIAESIANNSDKVVTSLMSNIMLIVDAIYIFNNLDKLGESAVEILTALATGLVISVYLLTDAVAKLIADVCIKFGETDWGEVGHNIINGVADGFEKVKETFTGVWEELKNNFCNFWDINSPSKVMADLTEFLPKGMSVGFKSGIPDTLNSFNSGMNDLSNGLNTDGITQKFKSVELSGIDFENIYSKMQGLNYSQSVPSYSNVVQLAYKSNGETLQQAENSDAQRTVIVENYLFKNSQKLNSFVINAGALENARSGGNSI